ncbi:MAG: hypothetical protein AB7V36_11540 [Bacteroidales bacterium]|nr:hypothetical protein [Bacteroidales bacterium]HPB02256.1 hypothetical protein [Bacteroidales bacterium]
MRLFAIFFLTAVIMTSCNWINPSEETPSFIKVESISFSTESTEGTENQNFTDAWVYINGEKTGAFEMPLTFPVLKEGPVTIQIYPGIILNGISNTRAIYPFVKPWEATINLVKDSVSIIQPASTYYDNLEFRVVEGFEDAGMTINSTTLSDTIMLRTSEPSEVFEGSFSGMLAIDTQRDTIDVRSNASYVLPQTGDYIFLELNFKTQAPLVVGVIANKGGYSVYHPLIILNETNTWKKVYINLSPVVSREYDADSFFFFFRMELPEGMSEAKAFIDNIKLIHAE